LSPADWLRSSGRISGIQIIKMNKIVKNDDGARVLYFFLYFSSFFNATHLGRFLAFRSCRKPRMNFFFKEQNQNI